jgi:hypothetical protein
MTVRNPTYGQAFAHLDAALAKNTHSNDIEKIARLRRALFGELPEDGPNTVNEFQKSEASPHRDRPFKL